MPYKDKDKQREFQRQWRKNKYHTDPEYRKKQKKCIADNHKYNLVIARQLIAEFRKNGCGKCDEKNHDCLCAHHKNPKTKKFSLGSLKGTKPTPDMVRKELRKCVCLCLNSHAKLHAKQRRRQTKKEINSVKKS